MTNFDKKQHWENIYSTKELNEVSWYQPVPETSLNFIKELNIPSDAKIIDMGGGDSFLVDHLLDLGYSNITILDISEAALNRAKKRLGDKSSLVKWIISDASKFSPTEKYDVWHDRAAFHFLTSEEDLQNYIASLDKGLNEKGKVIIGTFSLEGPTKCSGIEIKQYSEESLIHRFSTLLTKIDSKIVNHPTPFDTVQNFVFCTFHKK